MFKADLRRFVYHTEEIATLELGPYKLSATVEADNTAGPPDQEQDGFWPSLDPNDDGWIGLNPKTRKPYSRSTYERRWAEAERIMDAWKDGDWWWCGVIVEVFDPRDDDVVLGHAALWGIECNWPHTGKRGPGGHRAPRD